MEVAVKWLEAIFAQIPLPLLEVWGRFGFIVGFVLMVLAYGCFTLQPGGHWRLGRARWNWDAQTLVSMLLTFVLILGTGYIGSFIVLVPGAQTFESLKDLSVFLCLVLFGYPALVVVPFAYGLSDLIEGVPPSYLLDWLLGYFINPACFWVAAQLIGREPDFTKFKTWMLYVAFVLTFLAIEPQLWGYLCSKQFTSEISYRNITPALFFTTSVTWLLAPFAMLAAYPLARKVGLFWAEIPGHVKERVWGDSHWIWESRKDGAPPEAPAEGLSGVPIRMLIVTPFVVMVLVMVGAAAYLVLRSAETDAYKLAGRLHQEIAQNINLQLDDFLDQPLAAERDISAISGLLQAQPIASHGRAFVIDHDGHVLASSWKAGGEDGVVQEAIRHLTTSQAGLHHFQADVQYRFDVVTAKPLSRETWLAQATAYQDRRGGHRNWILMTAMPAAYYLEGVRAGNSQTAMVLALALTLALVVAGGLAAMVTTPIRRVVHATQALAYGDVTQRVPGGPLAELNGLSDAFNNMAERLGQFQERMLLASEALKLGIWDWNVVTNELIWDDQMYRLYGVHKEDFGEAYEAWAQRVLPEDFERANAEIQAALKGKREYSCEFRVRLPDGSIRYLHAASITFRDDQGKPVRMVGSNHDVTAQKMAEEEIRTLNAELEQRVSERTAQYEHANKALAEARDAAEAATQAKSEFLANMSHEIRTPMNAVIGMTDLALRTELTPKQQSYLNNARSAADSLLGIINDILDFSKIEAGKLELDMKEFLVDDLFQQVTTIVGHKAHEKGLAFLIHTAADVPLSLVGDSLRLAQILVNLCNNAIKFTDRGEIAIVTVLRRPSAEGQVHLRFAVRDSGIGMSTEQTARLFQPFNQADSSTTRKYGGTGLGLAICKQLVELMGGRIGVTSQLGQGSEFFFDLSLAAGRYLKPALPLPAEVEDGLGKRVLDDAATIERIRGLKVLLVEDNDINRLVAHGLLTEVAQVKLTVATHGQEALDCLTHDTFDLVLTDIQMPVMDGYEVARHIRSQPQWAHLPIIAMTAHAMQRDRDQCLAVGMNDFVTKPFEPHALFAVLAKWAPGALPEAGS